MLPAAGWGSGGKPQLCGASETPLYRRRAPGPGRETAAPPRPAQAAPAPRGPGQPGRAKDEPRSSARGKAWEPPARTQVAPGSYGETRRARPARTHHGRPDRTLATGRALLVERPGSPYGTGTGRKAATGCRKAAWGGERELRTPPRDRARGQSRVGVLPAVGGVRSSGGAQAGSGGGPQGGAPSRERVITSARGRPGASGAVRSGERSGTGGTLVEVLQRSVRDTSALGLGR